MAQIGLDALHQTFWHAGAKAACPLPQVLQVRRFANWTFLHAEVNLTRSTCWRIYFLVDLQSLWQAIVERARAEALAVACVHWSV